MTSDLPSVKSSANKEFNLFKKVVKNTDALKGIEESKKKAELLKKKKEEEAAMMQGQHRPSMQTRKLRPPLKTNNFLKVGDAIEKKLESPRPGKLTKKEEEEHSNFLD